jgi:phage tail-like protein
MSVLPPVGGDLATYAVKRFTGLSMDPFKTHRFVLDVQGLFVGGFMTIEGIGSRVAVETVREGGGNGVEYKLPGQVTCSDLVMTSGLTFADPMWLWYRCTLFGKPLRKNGTVYLMDDLGLPVAWWHLFNAWPIEWEGPHFDASQTLVAVQRFSLAYERITKGLSSSVAGGGASVLEGLL